MQFNRHTISVHAENGPFKHEKSRRDFEPNMDQNPSRRKAQKKTYQCAFSPFARSRTAWQQSGGRMEARRVQPRRAAWLVPAARAFAAALLEVLDLGLLVRNVALLGRHLLVGGAIGRRALAGGLGRGGRGRGAGGGRRRPAAGTGGLAGWTCARWDRERGLSAWWVYACLGCIVMLVRCTAKRSHGADECMPWSDALTAVGYRARHGLAGRLRTSESGPTRAAHA